MARLFPTAMSPHFTRVFKFSESRNWPIGMMTVAAWSEWELWLQLSHVWPVNCSNASARWWLGYVVSRNLTTACIRRYVLLTRGVSAHAAWGDGTDSGCVGSGNPPHTGFSSHSFSHLHVRPLTYHLICLCLHWASACVSMTVFDKEK